MAFVHYETTNIHQALEIFIHCLFTPHSNTRKLRHREFKWFAQSHTSGKLNRPKIWNQILLMPLVLNHCTELPRSQMFWKESIDMMDERHTLSLCLELLARIVNHSLQAALRARQSLWLKFSWSYTTVPWTWGMRESVSMDGMNDTAYICSIFISGMCVQHSTGSFHPYSKSAGNMDKYSLSYLSLEN